MNKFKIVKLIESLSGFIFISLLLYKGFNPEGFRLASIALMITQSFLIIAARVLGVKLTFAQKLLFVLTFVGGGLTVFYKNPFFIQIRGTVVNIGISFVLLISHFWSGKSIIERVFESALQGKNITIPKKLMNKVSYYTIVYFFLSGCLNYYVVMNFSKEGWAIYKYGVGIGVSFCFFMYIFYLLKDHLAPLFEEEDKK